MVSKLLMILPLLNQPYYSTSAIAASSISSIEVDELYSGMLSEDMMMLNPVGVSVSSSLEMTR